LKKTILKFKVVKPLFIACADLYNLDLEKEDIRPPSIREPLRIWFRTMKGEANE